MKTPAHRFTIHVIAATFVVTYLAGPRPSIWVRAWPSLTQGLTRARRGLVPSGCLARFMVAGLLHMIACAGIGAVNGIRLVYDLSIRWLVFGFLTIPLFLMGLLFLLATLAWAWAKLLNFEFLTSGRASALHILSQPLPISASVRRHAGAPALLCRHAVLHGEDTNYDRRIKSCERYPPELCLLGFL